MDITLFIEISTAWLNINILFLLEEIVIKRYLARCYDRVGIKVSSNKKCSYLYVVISIQ